MKSFRHASFIGLSLLFTSAIFCWIFSSVDLSQVLELIYRSQSGALIAFFIASLATSIFRAWRYRLLLRCLDYSPSRLSIFLVTLVRNLFSDLLPARVGTLIYVYLTTTRLGVPLAASTSSFAVAFVFDFIALGPLILLAALSLASAQVAWQGWLLLAGTIFTVLSCAALFFLPTFFRIATRYSAKLRSSYGGKIHSVLNEVQLALDKTIASKVYFQILTLSTLVRSGKYLTLYLLLFAMLAPLGFTYENLQPAKVFIGLVSAELAASLPIAGPAGLGAYQGAWSIVFEMLGFDSNLAKATSVSHHLFTQAYGYALGVLAMIVLSLPYFRVTASKVTQFKRDSNLRFICITGFAVIVIVAAIKAALELRWVR